MIEKIMLCTSNIEFYINIKYSISKHTECTSTR